MNFQLWLKLFLLLLGITAASIYVGVIIYHLFKPIKKKNKKSKNKYLLSQLKDVGGRL